MKKIVKLWVNEVVDDGHPVVVQIKALKPVACVRVGYMEISVEFEYNNSEDKRQGFKIYNQISQVADKYRRGFLTGRECDLDDIYA